MIEIIAHIKIGLGEVLRDKGGTGGEGEEEDGHSNSEDLLPHFFSKSKV